MVEFAFVSLLFYLLAAGTLSFGQAVFSLQVVQDAARVAARELSVLPLPANDISIEVLFGSELPTASQQEYVDLARERIYDSDCLAVNIDAFDFDEVCPLVNRMLRSVMIFDDSQGVRLLRYPGALRTFSENPLSGYTVAIPVVRSRGATGIETISWVPVVEELQNSSNLDPFNVNSGGIVAIRINYPFQSALLSAFLPADSGDAFDPNIGKPITADDSAVSVASGATSPTGSALADSGVGPYRGEFGLGRQFAYNRDVRPFRRLFSLQAIFRREVYVP